MAQPILGSPPRRLEVRYWCAPWRGLSIQSSQTLEDRLFINDMAQFDVSLCNIGEHRRNRSQLG